VRYFGERDREVETRSALAAVAAAVRELPGAPPGPVRHGALASALVRAAALAQGIADAERAPEGDDLGPGSRESLDALTALARALWASWRTGGRSDPPSPAPLEALAMGRVPERVRLRRAEGHAYYAVYPEAHAAAAEPLVGSGATVLGIRSIGTGLAAMVAAGAELAPPLATLRPAGHPFRRTVSLAPRLAAVLASRRGRPIAVADEGPGRSGSSFAAVLAALEELGFPTGRVHLFPSHAGGPGPEAGPEILARWEAAPRHHVAFEALLLGDHPLALRHLAEDVIGPPAGAPIDLGAGAWRRHAVPVGAPWPPSQGWRERRKYLLTAGGRTWLARFAGLGEEGTSALLRARLLAGAGLTVTPAALRHGFIFAPWLGEAVPLHAARLPRSSVLAAVRHHLAFVASELPARAEDGAAPAALLEMARENATEALGAEARAGLAGIETMLPEVERTARPVAVDGKVDAWEWLALPGGRILKADALDHHADHALPGCQDALWDVAGVELAFDLEPAEGVGLAHAVRAASPGAPPRVLPFYRACRSAFELARWSLSAGDPGVEAEEVGRRRAALARARDGLVRALSSAA
jgi:hypothetical protein